METRLLPFVRARYAEYCARKGAFSKANQAMTYSTSLRVLPGYNFIQLVDMTFANQIYNFLTYGGGRNSFGTIGTIQDI